MDSSKTDGRKIIDVMAMVLIIVGGINWGLVGFFGFNLVGFIFGEMSFLSRVVYALVGISAVYHGVSYKLTQRRWECNASLSTTSTNPTG